MPTALQLIEVITPSVLSLFTALLAAPPRPAPPELPGIRAITVRTVMPRRRWILLALVVLAATCASEAVLLIVDLITARYRDPAEQHGRSPWFVAAGGAHALGGLAVYSLAAIFAEYRLRWGDKTLVALALTAWGLEVPFLVLSVIREVHAGPVDRLYAILSIPPSCIRLIVLPILIVLVLNPVVKFQPADERTGLLAGNDADAEANSNEADSRGRNLTVQYGTFSGNGGQSESRDTSTTRTTNAATDAATDETPAPDTNEPPTDGANGKAKADNKDKIQIPKKLGEKKDAAQGISLKEFTARLRKLWPHLWPSTSWRLQLCCLSCIGIVVVVRCVNAVVPQALGNFVRTLTENQHGQVGTTSPWPSLAIYIGMRALQSGGIFSFLQNRFWIPVQQYADREMMVLCFNHLLDLSLAFHTKRNTGEVLRIIDRGSSINTLFQIMLFNATPTLLDILIYSSIFFWLYGPFLSFVMLVVMIAYTAFSIVFTGYRTKLRREMVDRDVKVRGITSDVLTNWESVKYFTAEQRESARFQDAVRDFQVTEAKVTISFSLLNLGQSFIMTFGVLTGSLMISWQILYGPWDGKGQPDAASFVVFLMYLQQLYGPLDRLGMLYRQLNSNATDAEKLFNLLAQKTEIRDSPDAEELVVTDGVIEFDKVCFSYDKEVQALKNVSFRIGKGESMALVGESGSGKSTILRLLYRFYDIDSGTIRIDGQDISKVTQQSLRRAIGIVPQDSVLWNDTIGANISYGKEGANDDEIIAAAKAAKLHDRILSFADGYSTVVGERGVRLSGGEKQRVSLARMFLKSPAILVLDEATSALDTETEREIQKALAELAEGRSSLSIAHRLSTVINSDQIVVMKDGSVIEHGSYRELLNIGGHFSRMWKKQIFTEAEMLAEASGTTTPASTSAASEPPFRLEPADLIPQPADSASASLVEALESDDIIVRASPPSTVAEHDDEDNAFSETEAEVRADQAPATLEPVSITPSATATPSVYTKTAQAFPEYSPSSAAPSITERERSEAPSKRNSLLAFPSEIFRSSSSRVSLSDSLQDGTGASPPDAKPRRKRLSSIKGFVRRLSSDHLNTNTNVPPAMSRSSSSNSIAIGGTPESEPPRPPSRTKRLSLSFESKRARRTSVPGNSTGNNGSQ